MTRPALIIPRVSLIPVDFTQMAHEFDKNFIQNYLGVVERTISILYRTYSKDKSSFGVRTILTIDDYLH